MNNYLFIINPIAGTRSKSDLPELIEQHLSDKIKRKVVYTERANHATEIALAERSNYDAIIAVGGDGTINEVAKGLIGSTTPLGIIPMGSGNGLARHMQLPLKLNNAIKILNMAKTTSIDTCTVNQESFLKRKS